MKNGVQKLAVAIMALMLLLQTAPALGTESATVEGIYKNRKRDEMFLVTFQDDAGNTLDAMNVQNGASVQGYAPEAPQREGYAFAGWRSSASELGDIRAKTVFTAEYEVKPTEEQPAEEQLTEEQPTDAQPTEEQSAEAQAPDAQPDIARSVDVERLMPDIIHDGEAFQLKANLVGFDGAEYTLQWQYDDGQGWTDAQDARMTGANALTLHVIADAQSVNYNWRIVVTLA